MDAAAAADPSAALPQRTTSGSSTAAEWVGRGAGVARMKEETAAGMSAGQLTAGPVQDSDESGAEAKRSEHQRLGGTSSGRRPLSRAGGAGGVGRFGSRRP
jgi:hypothetical protein